MADLELLRDLESGALRVVTQSPSGEWVTHTHVKQRIIDYFREAALVPMDPDGTQPHLAGYMDKEGLAPRQFGPEDGVRIAPGGSLIRPGTYVAKNVIILPPAFMNVGAYVDEGTMLDSHVLVGSCAYIGKRVHLSTAVQIGGVLEPSGDRPVIVEDDCFIGAGVILTEGIWVRTKAVLAPGVNLTKSVPIYDTVHEKIYYGEVPPGAVVVPGSRPYTSSSWAKDLGLNLSCAIIVKYRDSKTDGAVQLESALR
jgi:2,3,4,5-tetrahydropyridine-2-carboxylate N-succinyltransferase